MEIKAIRKLITEKIGVVLSIDSLADYISEEFFKKIAGSLKSLKSNQEEFLKIKQ